MISNYQNNFTLRKLLENISVKLDLFDEKFNSIDDKINNNTIINDKLNEITDRLNNLEQTIQYGLGHEIYNLWQYMYWYEDNFNQKITELKKYVDEKINSSSSSGSNIDLTKISEELEKLKTKIQEIEKRLPEEQEATAYINSNCIINGTLTANSLMIKDSNSNDHTNITPNWGKFNGSHGSFEISASTGSMKLSGDNGEINFTADTKAITITHGYNNVKSKMSFEGFECDEGKIKTKTGEFSEKITINGTELKTQETN